MSNQPLPVTKAELHELAQCAALRETWGHGSVDDMELALADVYVVKFDFMNESPGYCGDLFVIQPGHLAAEIPVIRVVRDRQKKLSVLHDDAV